MSWFFEKTIKIKKNSYQNYLKGTERKSQLTKLVMKMKTTIDIEESQRIIKTFFKNLYSTKLKI